MAAKLDGPIPGESLTKELGNQLWEQPPKFAKVEDALAYHMERLHDGENMDDMLFLLDQQFPLNVLVESWMTTAQMEGLQTVDVSLLIAPILHEYIKSLALAADVKLVERDGPSDAERATAKQKQRFMMMLETTLNESGGQSEMVEDVKTTLGSQKIETPVSTAENASKPPSKGMFRRPNEQRI